MNQPRIGLFVADHIRDLPGMVLTAFELCQRGAECFLIPFKGRAKEVLALAPDFILFPHFRRFVAPEMAQYVGAGIQYGLLDVEGVVWNSMDEYKRTLWEDPSLNQQARCVCAWGRLSAEHAIDNGIFEKRQVRVTGCPRFDFYKEPLATVYREQNASNGHSNRKLVLINTNFTIANTRGHTISKVAHDYIKKYGYDVSEEEIARWYADELRAIDLTIELANDLATDFPEVDVLVRPHPEERIDTYADRVKKIGNLRVSKAGSVFPWILQACAVLQRSCTTAVEANLAAVPALSPQWIPHSQYYPVPESVSVQCADYEYLKGVLREIFKGSFEPAAEVRKNQSGIIESWFYRIDGEAHRRVACAILESISPDVKPDMNKCLKSLYRLNGHAKFTRAYFANRLRYHLSLAPGWSFSDMSPSYNEALDDYFNDAEVARLVAAISAVTANRRPATVRVSRAHDSGAYITDRYRGRSIVMRAVRSTDSE